MKMNYEEECAACCRWYPGAWAWELENLRPVKMVPIKGSLSIYDIDNSLIEFLFKGQDFRGDQVEDSHK